MRTVSDRFRLGVVAFLVYALAALAFVWPLPEALSSRVTGDPAGDTGAYVWNAYVFLYNISTGSSVFTTDRILTLAGEVSLALHNNSLVLSAVAAPLIPLFGVVASFNLALITVLVLNPFCAYLLARHETRRFYPSLLAGALFGFSPFISARVEGHMSLATAFGLPLTILSARLAVERRGVLNWCLVGAALTICAVSDPYYLIFGILGVAAVGASALASLERTERVERVWLNWGLKGIACAMGLALLWIVAGGGGAISVGGVGVGIRDPHTPVLGLTIAAAALAFSSRPFRISLRPDAGPSLKYAGMALVVSAVLLSPWLRAAAGEVVRKGGLESPQWRNSPRGVDALSLVAPNPTHPLLRDSFEPLMTRERPDAFVEGVGSLTVSGVATVLWLVLRRRADIPRFWIFFTAAFALIALGPFVVVGGFQTYIPGPWALLRYVPGIGMARSPTRFAIMAMLGFSVMLAHALASADLGRRRNLAFFLIAALLGIETLTPPRRVFATGMPEMYRVIADDPCDVVVLRLPTGIKDGTRQRGSFSSDNQFHQVFHLKRLLGGYISRLSDDTVQAYENDPTVRALLDLSEGRSISAEARQAGIDGAESLSRRVGIGFIALNKDETSQDLRDFVHEAFRPRVVQKTSPVVVFVPFGEEDCKDGRCGHRPQCPLSRPPAN